MFAPQMDIKQARCTIVRKFTNERNRIKEKDDSQNAKLEAAMNAAATALVDFRTFSRGKSLFKEQNHAEILTRRAEILAMEDGLPLVAAHQRALKELWHDADQELWETQALLEPDDLYS